MWNQIQRGANGSKGRAVLPFEIAIEYAWDLFQAQNGQCALTGIPLVLPTYLGDAQTASLDRIDSSKGYVPGNVQWVHKDINRMKNAYDQSHFIDMCRLVAAKHATQYPYNS